MLIKRNDFMTSKALSVKKMGVSLLSALAVCTAAIAPSAFAGDSPLIKQTVTAKFKLSDLKAENGAHLVYTKLKRRSLSYCRKDSASLLYLGQSKEDCTADLLEQFIQNADIAELKAYHLSQTSFASTRKYTSNKY